MSAERESRAERVLGLVAQLPPGRVASYGDIGAVVGVPARQVGRIMAESAGTLPWWRVTNANGELPDHLLPEAYARWAAEGIGVFPGHCDIERCRLTKRQLSEL